MIIELLCRTVSSVSAISRRLILTLLLTVFSAVVTCAVQRLPELALQSPQELFNKANDYLENRHAPDSALLCLTALTSLAEVSENHNVSPEMCIIAYNVRGALYASVYGNYSEAAVNLLKGLDLAQRYGEKKWQPRIEYNISAMEYEQGRLMGNDSIADIALGRFSKILDQLTCSKDRDLIVPLLLSVAEIGVRENKIRETREIFAAISLRDTLSQPLQQLEQTIDYYDKGQSQDALESLEKAISSLKDSNSVMQSGCNNMFYLIKAHLLLQLGYEDKAIEMYDRVVNRCREEEDMFAVFEIYHHLRKYFEKSGDKARTVDYRLKEYEAKDQLINRSGTLSLEGSKALYSEEKLRHEIVTQAARTRTYKIIFWISLTFLIILSVLLVLLYRKFRQLNESRSIIVRNDMEYFRPEAKSSSSDVEIMTEPDITSALFDRITTVVRESEEIYDEEFNTGRLAELVGEKTGAVSSAITAVTGETTSQFLARTRIREACRRINDRVNYGDYTIEAIGQSVGYRSRSHFGAVFKKIVGMTPSEYIAKVREK